jgi:polysaccharide deacetylase family protein (PEP-CTERM system associated)
MEVADQDGRINGFSCELEDWFHILGTDRAPGIGEWPGLPLCAEKNVERLLELLAETGARATFFCLGWMAEQMPAVVRRCQQAGHEIGSHGYGHVLAYEAGPRAFLADIVRAKKILEDLTGEEVVGFRAPGFSVKHDNRWVFDLVAKAGYRYDASAFPAHHGHGGLPDVNPHPHEIETSEGSLVEIPMSTVSLLGRRVCLFGGGYLRLAPLPLIRWGVSQLHGAGRPLIIYIHPRELDPDHRRLPLPATRRFKCYVNLGTTMPKLKWLCEHYRFATMKTIAGHVAQGVTAKPSDAPAVSRKKLSVVADVAVRKPTLAPEHARPSQGKE